MKTAISLPDDLFADADALAERLGVNRSELYRRALQAYLAVHDRDRVTSTLDDIHGDAEGPALDPILGLLQDASLPDGEW